MTLANHAVTTQASDPLVSLPETGPDAAPPTDVLLAPSDTFPRRHVGPNAEEIREMLAVLGLDSLDELIDQTVPPGIRLNRPLKLEGLDERPRGEAESLVWLKSIVSKNVVKRSLIGMGYAGTITPPVIQRNILENPGWYTQYTPYQAEISQGRLEALLNFQQMVADLTGLPLANASMLDEATAAAEGMAMAKSIAGGGAKKNTFLVADDCHPQTIAVVRTRGGTMGIDVRVVPAAQLAGEASQAPNEVFGVLVQYPNTDGQINDHKALAETVHSAGGMVVAATDLLACCLITPPGEWGADICVGNSQRFGVPLGYGGPHAAFMSTKDEHARRMPGRLVGVSKDADGKIAYRLTLQTREQHIRREKATSNICTAQVLLAIMASMYAVYHGPHGLRRIAQRVHAFTAALSAGLQRLGHTVETATFFDTIRVRVNGLPTESIHAAAEAAGFNLRKFADGAVGITLDERTTQEEVQKLIECFGGGSTFRLNVAELAEHGLREQQEHFPQRKSEYLAHPVFNTHHAEHELTRYIFKLQGRDLSLVHSMIPLGSCTMKLNATSEMLPITWPELGEIHPFAPAQQAQGYAEMFRLLESWLAEITGFAAFSLQPNAGSQGEYAGLLAIRRYHESRGEAHRDVCLIPQSAHGTNPASAVIAGMRVVVVGTRENGDIDVDDLRKKAEQHKENLAALMVTYPSTHGVFEGHIREVCGVIHEFGGQVYMDGANMNAQVGLCRPGDFGADVCHLNLHKTFCIPHGGGGPGMGPIGVAEHLKPFLPGDPLEADQWPVSAAPWGSSSILPISWMYIAMMGPAGLKRATEVAILNANYMAKRLSEQYDILFAGKNGRCAHEFILDCRDFDRSAGVKVEDIAKRLMDYGFHAPTMSWPVPGTLMVEPTESEPKPELDRLCDALIAIRGEIARIESGELDKADNPLKNAPHTAEAVSADEWSHGYSRREAAFPAPWTRDNKFWPPVSRVDNVYGDRNLLCVCPPMEEYA